MAESGINALTGTTGSPQYPTFQPIQQINPLTQMQGALGLAQQQQSLQQGDISIGHKKLEILHNEMGALTSVPGGPSMDDVINRTAGLVQSGAFKPDEVARMLPNIPQGSGPEANAARKAFFDKQLQITGGYTGNMNAAYGAGVSMNNGNNTFFGRQDIRNPGNVAMPGGIQTPNGTAVPMTTTPAQRIEPRVVQTPSGPVNSTVGQAAAGAGMDPNSGNPLGPAFGKPGQYAPSGVVQGSAAPGPLQESGIKALSEDQTNASTRMAGVQPLLQALPLLEKLGTTGTGPGTKPWNDAKAFLISNGIISKGTSDVEMRNEVDKYLKQYVSKSALAGRSDFGAMMQQASSPNTTEQINPATINLTKNAIAYDRMEAARPSAFDETQPLSKYGDHKSKFTQSQDVNAYKLDLMNPQDRNAMIQQNQKWLQSGNAQQKTAAQRFFNSLRVADKAGVLNIAPGQ